MMRHCLLIGAPGSHAQANHLPGVSIDMANFERFVLSNIGGAWEPDEVTTLVNPTTTELFMALQRSSSCDYSFTLFSGHGGVSTVNNRTFLEINTRGDSVPAETLINRSPKELVIVDTCRSYFTPVELFGEEFVKAYRVDRIREAHRAFFDSIVGQAEPGFIILYSSSVGEAANDTESGGAFTQAILTAAQSIQHSGVRPGVVYVNRAFETSRQAVTNRFRQQNPCMVGSVRRRSWFPLAVQP